MMALEKIKEGDSVRPSFLRKILENMCFRGVRNFSVNGSLLEWGLEKFMSVLKVEREGREFKYHVRVDFPEDLGGEVKEKLRGGIRDAFLRSGACKHGNLQDVIGRLRNYDDVILAPDTNIILDCVISSVLLKEIYSAELPNWLLIAIPKITMDEVERKAYQKIEDLKHPRCGWPTYDGRIGQRGLQEILELDTNVTLRGLSIITVGKLPENYDAIIKDKGRRIDSEIRAQFGDFLKSINFHKGSFFLTQDRVNAMMARTEGIEGLYLQKPEWNDIVKGESIKGSFESVLYDLALTFGELEIIGTGEINSSLRLSIFWPEKHVSDWEKSRIKITRLNV